MDEQNQKDYFMGCRFDGANGNKSVTCLRTYNNVAGIAELKAVN